MGRLKDKIEKAEAQTTKETKNVVKKIMKNNKRTIVPEL